MSMQTVVSHVRRFGTLNTYADCLLSCGHTESVVIYRLRGHKQFPVPKRKRCVQCQQANSTSEP